MRPASFIDAEMQKYAHPQAPINQNGSATRGQEEEEEEDEEDYDDDFREDDLMWFDGHEGVSGDFTKTFKAEVAGNRPNSAASQHAAVKVKQQNFMKRFQPSSVRNAKAEGKINTGSMSEQRLEQLAQGLQKDVFGAGDNKSSSQGKTKDKADRATTDQVLDPRTRMVLYKLLNKETLNSIHGCVSTGKEANVYYATTSPETLDSYGVAGSRTSDGKEGELAIKVYKTSILVFKDRDKYVSGDYRFRNGYNKHNPRKMVKMWAEKEFRNLMRMQDAGIPCPKPILLRLHLLLMEFIGKNGKASPRLKDANISLAKLGQAYVDCVLAMRKMYQKCKLVHGDLSEYNMLYHRGTLFIIDVSQSVDLDHPNALEFLRRDAANVNDYFGKKGVDVMSVRQLFDFCVDASIGESDAAAEGYLSKLQAVLSSRTSEMTNEEEVEAAVFQQSYIPNSLGEIDYAHINRDHMRLQAGDQQVYYGTVTGMSSSIADRKSVV